MGRSHKRRRHSRGEYGQTWSLAAALLDGPRTIDEIQEYYRKMGRQFGIFKLPEEHTESHTTFLKENLCELLGKGWAVVDTRCPADPPGVTVDMYRLTESGREEAQKMLSELERGGEFFEKATRPQTVSIVTLIVHLTLAAVKLPAAILSGSVGLLNDALDTLLDGISSLFVYFGIRFRRERLANIILCVFMLATGGYSAFEAISGFFGPHHPTADPPAFTAAGISALLCALLYFYQKYSGLKHDNLALITQSVDSRNHVLVALGVTAGLIAALADAPLLDLLVGVAVATMILKGGVEMTIELIRTDPDESLNRTRHGFKTFDRFRRRQCKSWLLSLMRDGRVATMDELRELAGTSMDASELKPFAALGFTDNHSPKEFIDRCLHEMIEAGDIDTETFSLTPRGVARADAFAGPDGKVGTPLLRWVFRGGAVLPRSVVYVLLIVGGRYLLHFLPNFDLWPGHPALFSILDVGFGRIELIAAGVGFVPYLLGRFLMGTASRALHRRSRGGATDSPGRLVTGGPFSRRRHPMYAGMLLTLLGWSLGVASLWGTFLFLLCFGVRFVELGWEESELRRIFGAEFDEYVRETPVGMFRTWQWVVIDVLAIAPLVVRIVSAG